MMANHLINMTGELIIDLQDKYEAASKIQDTYKKALSYELGYLAAGIMEKFKVMLEIYRTYCNMKDFVNKTYQINQYLDGYHVIQGEYNDLRRQTGMYHAKLAVFKQINDAREKYFNRLYVLCPAHIKKFKQVPTEVLKDTKNIAYNLKAYKVIAKCSKEKNLSRELSRIKWPNEDINIDNTRRYLGKVKLPLQRTVKADYKTLKWTPKVDFKAIEDIDINFT